MVFGTIRLRHSNAFVCVFQCVSMLAMYFACVLGPQQRNRVYRSVRPRAFAASKFTRHHYFSYHTHKQVRMHTQRASDQPASYCSSDEITDTKYKRLLIHLSMEKIEKLNSSPLRASRMVWHIVGNVNYAMFAVWRRK